MKIKLFKCIAYLRKYISEMNLRFPNLYLYIFIFWYLTDIIFNTTLKTFFGIPAGTLNSLVSLSVFVLLMVQIMLLLPSFEKRELIIITCITIPVAVATLLSGHRTMLSAWMFIVASKNESMDRMVRTVFKILIIAIPLVCISYMMGWLEDNVVVMRGLERSSMGFSHPNQLGLSIFQLAVCYCYINKEKNNILNYIFIIAAMIFVYTVPNSQTACICLLMLLVVLSIYKYIIKYKQVMVKIYMVILWIGALFMNVFSIILSYIDIHKYSALSGIDRWASARFSLGHRVWEIHGVSFFGQMVYVSEEERALAGITERLWLDNAYLCILLRYGILVFILFSAAYLWMIKYAAARKKYILAIILFLYALYGVMENGLFVLAHNIFLIAFADLLYKKEERAVYEKGDL